MTRTPLQREADRIDCELCRLIEGSCGTMQFRELNDVTRLLTAARGKVRRHMHPEDKAATR